MHVHGWIIPALLLGAPVGAPGEATSPRLEKGLELVWRGEFTEELSRPGARTERAYSWEARLLVLERAPSAWRAALQTTLRQRRGANGKARELPTVVHIALIQVDDRGRVLLAPADAEKSPPRPLPTPSLDGLPTLETGMFLEAPARGLAEGLEWTEPAGNLPPRRWKVEGVEDHRGSRCFKVTGTQQTPAWAAGRGKDPAWRRVDTAWVSASNGYAARRERVAERLDPESREVELRTRLAYEQVQRMHYAGGLFEDRRAEAARALALSAELQRLLRDGGRSGTGPFEALVRRVERHEADHPANESMPYREALNAVRRRAEAAKRGHIPPVPPTGEETAEPVDGLAVGRPAPDFTAAALNRQGRVRLARMLGRPLVLLYYQPAAPSAGPLLRFAEELHAAEGGRVAVLAVAIGDEARAREQAESLKLTVPVLAGNEAYKLHGVPATPRAAVLDEAGVVRRVLAGWGDETPGVIRRELGLK